MDLSGTWRATPVDDELRRTAIGLDFDGDDAWEALHVPGHWRSHPAFAQHDGPLLYRRRFELDAEREDSRYWVVLDGIFYQGDVWLDGAYLGDPEGYFFPHAYEITGLARLGREHVLAVEVSCAPPQDRRAKRAVTGVFQHWDVLDPDWNPGGLWRPVRVVRSGPVRIESVRVACREADAERAQLLVTAVLDSDAFRTVQIRTMVGDRIERATEHPIAKGRNTVEWTFGVDNPDLWWPWALGDQPLTTLQVEVLVDQMVSDERSVRTGLRQVGMRDWQLSVNGERLFVKGANLGPTRMALADATPEELRRDVVLAREAGLDLVRIHGHVTRPELYDAADELGVLVWQDFPLQWGYHRSIRRQAVRQARRMVEVLGHHPAVAVWCGHNEPIAIDVVPGKPLDTRTKLAYAAGQLAPVTWNRSVLDRSVKRSIERADPSRPVVAHSGIAPHPPLLDGTSSHLYFGWYYGDEGDLPGFAASVPRMVRFVSEFGAQAVPEDASFLQPERWPDLDWEAAERHHALQRWVFDQRVPPQEYATFDAWRRATQAYQADLLRHQVEALRRLKYHPTGGFCMFALADAHPAVSWSVLGHDRQAKAGYAALAEACRPVIVVADRLPPALAPGQRLKLDVHVVNDLRTPLTDAVVTARCVGTEGVVQTWRWRGDVPADGVARVGRVEVAAPRSPGPLEIDLDLMCGEVVASNRYISVVSPG